MTETPVAGAQIPLDARILAALRKSTLHLLPSELARATDCDPAALSERVAALQEAGFAIESRPELGYLLRSEPDRLVADDLWARLHPDGERSPEGGLISNILIFEETASTNDLCMQLGRNGQPPGLVIFAEKQTAGRGRFGRQWASAAHLGLWFSLLLRPKLPFAEWPKLTAWTACCLASALEGVAPVSCQVKWPNDLQIRRKKVCGILVETGTDLDGAPFAVLGIGLNVNHELADFPEPLMATATSLRTETERVHSRPRIAAAVLAELSRSEHALLHRFDAVVEDLRRRSSVLGEWIRVRSGTGEWEGLAHSIDSQGHLLLQLADGEMKRISAGEVA